MERDWCVRIWWVGTPRGKSLLRYRVVFACETGCGRIATSLGRMAMHVLRLARRSAKKRLSTALVYILIDNLELVVVRGIV